MPQLWLTYQEMAEEFGGNPASARAASIERGLTRKHSSDGLTRVLMPPDLMRAFFRAKAHAEAAPLSPLDQLRHELDRQPLAPRPADWPARAPAPLDPPSERPAARYGR